MNFLDNINSSFANIGINQYGSHLIQKLMDYINNDIEFYKIEKFFLFDNLKDKLINKIMEEDNLR